MSVIQIISLIVVVVLFGLGMFFIIKKSKEHTLVKLVSLLILLGIALTWIFSYGYFRGTVFYDYGMNQQGLADIPQLLYYVVEFAGDKIIFLGALGLFYGILSKCSGYQKLVNKIAQKLKGKEILFTLISSLFFVAMTVMLSQTFIVLIFVPFIISILLRMGLDKISAFAATFGSILIANLGLVYGGEGLYWFNYYTGTTIDTAILYRVLVLAVAFILFSFFTITHIKKLLANNENKKEIEADPFVVEKNDEKAKTWPTIVLLALLFILCILGFVDWQGNWGITVFVDFHSWLLNLHIKDFYVFTALLGSAAKETWFGAWNLFIASIMLSIFAIVFALMDRMKLNDFISNSLNGLKKMAKPIGLFILAYVVMLPAYMSPFMPQITNLVFGSIPSFNPYLISLDAFVSTIFHVDFGYTGYAIGSFFISAYAANSAIIHTIFVTMYGLASLIVPSSTVLILGLSYLNIEYKSWIKYIWIFAVAMLVILLVLITVMTYI